MILVVDNIFKDLLLLLNRQRKVLMTQRFKSATQTRTQRKLTPKLKQLKMKNQRKKKNQVKDLMRTLRRTFQLKVIQKRDKDHEEGRKAVQTIHQDKIKEAEHLIEEVKKEKQMNQNKPGGASIQNQIGHQPMMNANGRVPVNVNVTVNKQGQQNNHV
ncbi:UNKNOWN [Stylonychia lemnae]|uniref:Uncharacterized protein n=1 Tax=Stylonychia lemnae TaxID=5949 RepID=A0A077ZTZ4_STYLE|nr:UNKNOWN [Stylonychia lemnae]|eukprot:CDW72790.1 UNKNOWN [Stylonychia lemnae]